ncbi:MULTISPECIES: hypothetical protein [unclassified Microcoleus]|nr:MULTISPECIES: hypothetical protein [unclassified Microcoleus]
MNSLILISPNQGSGFQPIISGNYQLPITNYPLPIPHYRFPITN